MKLNKKIASLVLVTVLLQPNAFANPYEVAGLQFEAPSGWNETQPTSGLRKFQFNIPGTTEEQNAELVIFYFGADQGGDINTNIDRWAQQFTELTSTYPPARTEFSVGDIKVTLVQLEGTYQSGMPGMAMDAKKDYAVLAAIVEGNQGLVFFKLMGPKVRISELLPPFRTLLDNLKLQPA